MAPLGGTTAIAPNTLDRYTYQPLADEHAEIRLIRLLQGTIDEPIRIQIFHATLARTRNSNSPRITRSELQKSLPPGWTVHITLEGRFIFYYKPGASTSRSDDDEAGYRYTWTHPDPGFDGSIYDLAFDDKLLDQEPSFEALSYVWGPQDDPQTAIVEYQDGTQPQGIPIGKNLEAALRHLRYEHADRTLWIDAICINQNDETEKSIQIKRMVSIYTLASRVVAWIGLEEDRSELAMATLEHLGRQVEITADGYRMASPDAEQKVWYYSHVDLPYSREIWDAIHLLCEREWFYRLWIVQEVALANRRAIVQCGKHTVSWALFRRAIKCLTGKTTLPKPGLRMSIEWIVPLLENHTGQRGELIIRKHGSRKCLSKHDKIYGFLGILPPKFAAAIVPDYSRDVSDTYRAAFLANINTIHRWELFGVDLAQRVAGGPSWVPDLIPPHSNSFRTEQLSSGPSRLDFAYSEAEPQKLTVTGLACAVVRTAGLIVNSDPQLALKDIRSWQPADLHTAGYVAGGTAVDAYALTLLQLDVRDRWPVEGLPTLEEWKEHAQGYLWDAELPRPAKPRLEYLDSGDNTTNMAYVRCRGRSFITTDVGYFGLGPVGVKNGDVICVLLGCSCPVVLRPQAGDTFLLVGHAFVYGLEDTIPLLGKLPAPWVVRVFDQPERWSRDIYKFLNPATGELSLEDPRLEPHPLWERVALEELGRELTGDDPQDCAFFRHKETGEIMDSDPRLLPEALAARGVELVKFTLV